MIMEDCVPGWLDDHVMATYLGHLPPSRESDPAHWNQKIRFWEKAVQSTQRARVDNRSSSGCLTFTSSELASRFTRNGVSPRCLPRVLAHLLANKSLAKATTSQSSSMLVTARDTVASLASLLYGLTLGDNTSAEASPPDPNEPLVVPKLIHEYARRIYESQSQAVVTQRSDLLIPFDELSTKFRFNTEDLLRLLESLKGMGLASPVPLSDKPTTAAERWKVVRFTPAGETKSVDLASDRYLAMYKLTLRDLDRRCEQIESDLEKQTLHIRKMIRAKAKKEKLMFLLRRKKRIEKKLKNVNSQRENVERIYESLQQVESDKQVLVVLRKGSDRLAKVINEHGLQPEAVAEVLDDVRERVEDAESLGEALAEPIKEEDEEQYECELAALEREAAKEETKCKQMSPSVPIKEVSTPTLPQELSTSALDKEVKTLPGEKLISDKVSEGNVDTKIEMDYAALELADSTPVVRLKERKTVLMT